MFLTYKIGQDMYSFFVVEMFKNSAKYRKWLYIGFNSKF